MEVKLIKSKIYLLRISSASNFLKFSCTLQFFGGNEGTPAQINEICSSFQDKIDGVGPHVTGKRQHRPPRRYMDEYLVAKANINRRTCEISRNMTSKRELIKAKPRKIKESADIKQEEPFQGACIQVPFGLPLEEEQVKEKSTCLTWSIVPVSPVINNSYRTSSYGLVWSSWESADKTMYMLIFCLLVP